MFGTILHKKSDTPPDSLVLRILQPKQFTSPATEWDKNHGSTAIRKYIQFQHDHGHPSLTVMASRIHISLKHPFLGASPDDSVYDPSTTSQPFGFLEVKCPYSARNMTPVETCSLPNFFCTLLKNTDGSEKMVLHTNHQCHAQIQGQMATDRQ